MTDHELLELAARAVGLYGDGVEPCWTESEHPRGSGEYGAFWTYEGWGDAAVLWNPLNDDADAFRLMVEIGVDECVDYIRGALEANSIPPTGCKHAATRRAIVMAAAEIGRKI